MPEELTSRIAKGKVHGKLVRLLAAAALAAFAASGFSAQAPPPAQGASGAKTPAPPGEEIEVPPPPFTEGIFPCTQCHDGKTVPLNTTRRELVDMHDDIGLHHGPNR
ncbi:MAG: hypothetical protein ACP5VN_07950 [Acidobacteriota bacterium]